jgi:lipid A disaccharide synthetase
MEPFRSSNFSEPNTGLEPFHALGMEPFHSVLPGSRTEHILSLLHVLATAGSYFKVQWTNKSILSKQSMQADTLLIIETKQYRNRRSALEKSQEQLVDTMALVNMKI